jgi:hypothetical protein
MKFLQLLKQFVFSIFFLAFYVLTEKFRFHMIKKDVNKRVSTENTASIEKAKRSIVLIKSRVEVPFINDSDDAKQSTGFIVDKEKGLILTSRGTARMSPAVIKVQFYDGSISNGQVIYSDPFFPFGIIKVDPKYTTSSQFHKLKLGSTTDSKTYFPSANVLLICLADDENYVIKKGKIVNTNRNYQRKYGSLFQVSSFHLNE